MGCVNSYLADTHKNKEVKADGKLVVKKAASDERMKVYKKYMNMDLIAYIPRTKFVPSSKSDEYTIMYDIHGYTYEPADISTLIGREFKDKTDEENLITTWNADLRARILGLRYSQFTRFQVFDSPGIYKIEKDNEIHLQCIAGITSDTDVHVSICLSNTYHISSIIRPTLLEANKDHAFGEYYSMAMGIRYIVYENVIPNYAEDNCLSIEVSCPCTITFHIVEPRGISDLRYKEILKHESVIAIGNKRCYLQ